MALPIINTREDLDAAIGTPRHDEFMAYLKGSMSRKQDTQVYPAEYNQPDYAGPKLQPIWQDVEDLTTIERFGFTKADFA
jgi:hypothetical protein